jgi:hypothetical protein
MPISLTCRHSLQKRASRQGSLPVDDFQEAGLCKNCLHQESRFSLPKIGPDLVKEVSGLVKYLQPHAFMREPYLEAWKMSEHSAWHKDSLGPRQDTPREKRIWLIVCWAYSTSTCHFSMAKALGHSLGCRKIF